MEGLKKLFQGKKGKFFIAAIIVVAILGFIAMRKKASTATTSVIDGYATNPTTPSTSTTGGSAGSATPDVTRADVVGLLSDYNTVVQDALKKQTDQNKSLSDSVNTALAYQQSGFNQTFAGIQSGLGTLSSKVNEGLLANAQMKLQGASQLPTYDDSAYGGFNQPAAAVGVTATSTAAAVKSNVVDLFGTGKGGIDYNAKTTTTEQKQAIQTNEARLQSDPAFRESEKVRAAGVIKNLKDQGKDTSTQESYLKKLG